MRFERGAVRALIAVLGIAAAFSFPQGEAKAAFQACACRCIDADVTEKSYVAPQQDCRSACIANPGGHTADQFVSAERTTVSTGDRCVCEWSVPQTRIQWTTLTAGRTSCSADCASACGGSANVDSIYSATPQTVDCFRDDHCATGQFSVYAQRNDCAATDPNCGVPRCQILGLDPTQKGYLPPRCLIPPTALNADIECQTYGGAAKGGVCRKIESGENPTEYILTRPYVQADGTYAVSTIDTQSTTYTNNPDRLNQYLAGLNPGPGLCELYGELTEVTIGSTVPNTNPYGESMIGITFGSASPPANSQPLSVTPSRKYVCAVRKMNTCGTVKPTAADGALTIQTANAYGCVDPIRVGLQGQEATACFSEQRSQNELCVNSPGTRCCAEAGAGCRSDVDCVLPKKCQNINAQTGFGTCGYVTVCDSQNTARRCRSATMTERENPTICSPELVPGTSRCGTSAQACCGPAPSGIVSPCAVDLVGQTIAGRRFTENDASAFLCFGLSQIRSLQSNQNVWRQNGNDTELIPFLDGGACLTNNDPARLQSGGTRVLRCPGADEVCCNANTIGQAAQLQDLNSRPTSGACGTRSGFTCRAMPSISETALNAHGFANAWSYQAALAASPYCQITPLMTGSYASNRECAPNYVCCATAAQISGQAWCATDADCASRPGTVCDQAMKQCMPGTLASQAPRNNCVDFARAAGDSTVSSIVTPGEEDRYSCQLVSDADREQNRTLCLLRGCEAENGSAAAVEGASYRCCAPGVGQAPSAVAAAQRAAITGQATVKPAPGSIPLSTCIASGDCTLDDILISGAGFANFLIRISGAVFLAIFIYAGFLYLTAAQSDRAAKAKTMLINATWGIALVMSAYVIVRFLEQSFVSNALNERQTATKRCGETPETSSHMCVFLNVDPSDGKALRQAISDKKCIQHLCPDNKAANYVCCPTE